MKGSGEKGLRGEDEALQYFMENGYLLLEKRFRALGGEVDLILEKDSVLIFVEVKYRPKGEKGDGFMAVTPIKQRRIIKAAGYYLEKTGGFLKPLRFDVVEITGQGLIHVENAFSGAWDE